MPILHPALDLWDCVSTIDRGKNPPASPPASMGWMRILPYLVSMQQEIESWLRAYTEVYPFAGTVLVRHEGQRLYAGHFGAAERAFGTAFRLDTRVPIASVGKAFTAGLVIRLAQSGLLSLDHPVNDYLPAVYATDPRITVWQLLTHRAGLADYALTGAALEQFFAVPVPPAKWVQTMLRQDLIHEPGATFAYANPGYFLLGLMVEHICACPLAEAFSQEIWQPLGLDDTGVDNPSRLIERRASGYTYQAGEIVPAPFTDARNFIPQGGLYSSVLDLEKWHQALLESDFLQAPFRGRMFSPPAAGIERPYYAAGWHVLDRHDRLVQGHGGSHWGYRTHLERYPESDTLIVVLSNLDFVDCFKIAGTLSNFVFGEIPAKPERPARWAGDSTLLEPLMGAYRKGNWEMELRYEQGDYTLRMGGEQPHVVYPVAPDKFQHIWLDECYSFTQNEQGRWQVWGCTQVD